MSNSSLSIILVEDDKNIRQLVETHIKEEGYVVQSFEDGESALKKIPSLKGDLIVLDVMLPKTNGFEVCKQLRAAGIQTPILFLTARSDEIDRVLGLELGGDDYVLKPFSIRELLARIKAILKRTRPDSATSTSEEILTFGPLVIDQARRKVTVHNKEVELTATEFDLLFCLAKRAGKPLSRQDLLALVWDYNFEGYEQTVSTHINRLRNKLEVNPSKPKLIETVWGVGYRFAETYVGK